MQTLWTILAKMPTSIYSYKEIMHIYFPRHTISRTIALSYIAIENSCGNKKLTEMADTDDIIFKEIEGQGGNIGLITLNRPAALNALTHDMCKELNHVLIEWAEAKHIKAVVIQGAGDKAFSAGGDILQLYHHGKAGRFDNIRDFFRDEYRLNYRIHTYPKPFISLLDGIAMGGGVGVSIHGSHRVVTERFVFAMPETAIGFFPDIGASYFLPRCPGETGVYLGLTGMRLNAAEAIYVELADHFISSNHLSELVTVLAQTKFNGDHFEAVTAILQEISVKPETPQLAIHRQDIDECFCLDTVEEIIEILEEKNHVWHHDTIKMLQKKSPTSLKVSLRELREGVALDFEACMRMEYRLCQHFVLGHDFYEGVRAVLVDKDHSPKWHPDQLADVSDEKVESFFAILPDCELDLEDDNSTSSST